MSLLKNRFKDDKRGIETEVLIKIVLWIIFLAVIIVGISYLLKKFGLFS